MNSRSDRINRRQFLEGTLGGMALASMSRAQAPGLETLGANERIRLGCIGTGGQGTHHIGQWAKMNDVRIVAVCDVDQARLANAAKVAGSSPDMTKDFREVLGRKDIDAVCIATPDHWHTPLAIRACQAGKHIYVEKPISHNVREGRAIADAARKAGVVVLHGTQQRSSSHWGNAVRRIKDGEIGKVNMVHAWNAWATEQMFGNIGRPDDAADPPPGVDYDMWLGPAPKRKFNPAHFHGTFYFFWDYAGGMISDWAVHLFDIVMWAMGYGFKSVSTIGGKFVHDDMRETPDTASAVFECSGYNLYYSMRHGNSWKPHGKLDHGIEFFGTEGTLQIDRMGFQIYDEQNSAQRKPRYSEEDKVDDSFEHKRHFLDCIRSKATKPRCDAEEGHKACIYGHLANIAYRVGRRIEWDAAKETILSDPEAEKLLARTYREPWTL
ncbi:MAG TPA: Gfo/Idh/MocA family oxidoreductase [Phycisphaerae bacterium]|nr:Gfo/Idh/MocA family oxidoreductase [Phycisphaerae bacterium]HRR84789.1 Gfo/Idh/MocA family oxidoreductase [Phycisphaerae bacterium]